MIGRRGFLASLAALVAAPFIPTPAPILQSLKFHPDAFALTMAPMVTRFDVIYGVASLRPEFACRVCDDSPIATGSFRTYLNQDAAIQKQIRSRAAGAFTEKAGA